MTIEPDRTGVFGAGLMGRDIAGLLVNAGYPVTLVDVDPDAIDAVRCYHETDLAVALETGGLEVAGTPADRIEYATTGDALEDVDFVVEAVPERLELKRVVLEDWEAVLEPDAVIGTNTSSLTAGEIAFVAAHPERVVVFHFANPGCSVTWSRSPATTPTTGRSRRRDGGAGDRPRTDPSPGRTPRELPFAAFGEHQVRRHLGGSRRGAG